MNKLNAIKIIMNVMFFSLFISSSNAADEVGKTMIARGEVQAGSSEQVNKRPLKRRSSIFENDIISTGASSKTQLRMTDGSMIAMKENTELVIAEYTYNSENGKNSAVLDLVQGGLRSITGAIKAEKGDYKLTTPIGSIGIRGTHFEVELLNGTVWIAVWDGAIDVLLSTGLKSGSMLSLGVGENYSYAAIDKEGVVTTYIEPPQIFEQGMSSKATEITKKSTNDDTATKVDVKRSAYEEINTALIISSIEEGYTEFISYDELNSLAPQNTYELVAAKQGTIEYSAATVISDYNLSNFTAGMEIDFDTGRISNGQLSFNDDRSSDAWNAVFNGNMHIKNDAVFLEVGITFASHGNNLADGIISANFIDFFGLDAVSGGFQLHEQTGDVEVDGSYLIRAKY